MRFPIANCRLPIVVLVGLVVSFAGVARGASIDEQAKKLFNSLSDEQKKSAMLPFDDKERNSEVFPGGPRPGIQIKKLTDEQQKSAIALITAFTSDYGREKAQAISQQGEVEDHGLSRYYVCFFGDPTKDKHYAWRIAEHHLTLVHVEVEDGKPTVFGPILLGANPPTLWDDEEDALIALYKALSTDEIAKVSRRGKGISAEMFKDGEGVDVRELSDAARAAIKAVFEGRLEFFAPEVQERIRAIVEKQGGIDTMRVAFWGAADKRCRDGGKWDFKLGGKAFLCDYENSRAHIHMAMKGWLDNAPSP